MYLITAIPIYRNRFQKPAIYFSTQNFLAGSIIFAPLNKKDRSAMVIESKTLEDVKYFIRKNKIKIEKINSKTEIKLFKKDILELLKIASEKTSTPIEEILQKITPKKILQELNKITPDKKDVENIQKFTDQISVELIKNKLKISPQKNNFKKEKEVASINSIISLKNLEQKKLSLHSEKHYLVNEIRNYFGETSKKGVGSFSFYLGFFKKIPQKIIYQYWSETKQSRKSISSQQKIFWWKIGQYLKEKKSLTK